MKQPIGIFISCSTLMQRGNPLRLPIPHLDTIESIRRKKTHNQRSFETLLPGWTKGHEVTGALFGFTSAGCWGDGSVDGSRDGSPHSRRSDGPVSLQSGRVPDLGLDGEAAELRRPCAELHPDGCAAVVAELVFGEAGEKVALSHTGFSD